AVWACAGPLIRWRTDGTVKLVYRVKCNNFRDRRYRVSYQAQYNDYVYLPGIDAELGKYKPGGFQPLSSGHEGPGTGPFHHYRGSRRGVYRPGDSGVAV